MQTARSVADDQLIISHSARYGGLTPVETKRVRAYASSHCKHPSFAAKMQPSFVGSNFCMVNDVLTFDKYYSQLSVCLVLLHN